jgi:aminopeptidase N
MEDKRVGFSSDHETSMFCNGILNATEKEFDFMWNLYKNSSVSSRRSFYLSSIGCIENEKILTRFIMTIIEIGTIDNTNDEWLTIVQAVYANGPIGMRVTFKFLRENYDEFIGL